MMHAMAQTRTQIALRPDIITQVEALQREVEALREELRRAEQLATLGTLGAMVAHEVNNLMTPVISYAQMAQGNPGDRELVAKALERAVYGATQASYTAEAILRLARGDAESGPDHCEVGRVLEDVIACVPRGTRRCVTIRTHAEAMLSGAINPVALQQIVLNLLLNALRAGGLVDVVAPTPSTLRSAPG